MPLTKLQVQEGFTQIKQSLQSLKEDDALPKNVKAKIDTILNSLEEEADLSVKIGKALHVLDEISEDLNVPPFLRSNIWSISSSLEELNK